jgi:hypothetical protein
MFKGKIEFTLGKFRFTLAVGDANNNGRADVSLTVRIIDLFELPPFVVDLDTKGINDAIGGFEALGKSLGATIKRK